MDIQHILSLSLCHYCLFVGCFVGAVQLHCGQRSGQHRESHHWDIVYVAKVSPLWWYEEFQWQNRRRIGMANESCFVCSSISLCGCRFPPISLACMNANVPVPTRPTHRPATTKRLIWKSVVCWVKKPPMFVAKQHLKYHYFILLLLLLVRSILILNDVFHHHSASIQTHIRLTNATRRYVSAQNWTLSAARATPRRR